MKDIRVTKCLISATALIVIVAMPPLISSLALAQQVFPNLKVTVFNETDRKCGNGLERRCPELNNMLTTVRFGNFFAVLPAGRCENQPPPCVGPTRLFTVFVGQGVVIGANMGIPPVGWKLETPHIVGGPGNVGNCKDIFAHRCEFTFPGPTNIEVHYHWVSVGAGAIPPNDLAPDNTGEAGGGGGTANGGNANGANGGNANGGNANSGGEGDNSAP